MIKRLLKLLLHSLKIFVPEFVVIVERLELVPGITKSLFCNIRRAKKKDRRVSSSSMIY
jgi:hypothetical protein